MTDDYTRSIRTITKIPQVADNDAVRIITSRSIERNSLASVDCFSRFCEEGSRSLVQHCLRRECNIGGAIIICDRQSHCVVAIISISMTDNHTSTVRTITKNPQVTNNNTVRIITSRSIEDNRLAGIHGNRRFGERCDRKLVQNCLDGGTGVCDTIIISNSQHYGEVAIINIGVAGHNFRSIGAVAEIPEITDDRPVRVVAEACIERDGLACIDCFSRFCEYGDRCDVQDGFGGAC